MQIGNIGSDGSDSLSIVKLIAEMRKKMLEKLDQNNDGDIDQNELANLAGKTGSKVDAIIDEYDTNKDGVLDAAEAEKMFEDMRPKNPSLPPDQLTGATGADAGDTKATNTIQSLLDALQNSDTDQAARDNLVRLIQNMLQTYTTDNAANTASVNSLKIQA
jgi:Ca2+-binding EF-hand superfamily protein